MQHKSTLCVKYYLNGSISCDILLFVTPSMNLFSIKDIENLTGIKAHTLRIWEQRYNFLNPKRKQSKHRFYDNEDLKFILRIAYLYNNGFKISRIACFREEEIKKLALELKPGAENYDIFINQLTEASIDLNQERFEKILNNLVLHAGFEKSITHVIFPMLKNMGLLWITGNIIPAQEHFASSLIVKKMIVAIDGLERPEYNGERRVILFTPKGELHEIPLLFMQYMLKKHGIPHIYLGKNVCLGSLQEFCHERAFSQLYLHLITNLIRCEIKEYLMKLSSMFPDKEIIFSGSTTCQVSCMLPPNIRALKNNEELMTFACNGDN